MDKCSWEWIKPIGYYPFELKTKGNHWLYPVWMMMTVFHWIPGQTALSQYLNLFRIQILFYQKSKMKDIYMHVSMIFSPVTWTKLIIHPLVSLNSNNQVEKLIELMHEWKLYDSDLIICWMHPCMRVLYLLNAYEFTTPWLISIFNVCIAQLFSPACCPSVRPCISWLSTCIHPKLN